MLSASVGWHVVAAKSRMRLACSPSPISITAIRTVISSSPASSSRAWKKKLEGKHVCFQTLSPSCTWAPWSKAHMFLIYKLLIEKLKCVHLRRTERSVVATRRKRRAPGGVAARSNLSTCCLHTNICSPRWDIKWTIRWPKEENVTVFLIEDLEKSSVYDSEEDFFFSALGPTLLCPVNRFVLWFHNYNINLKKIWGLNRLLQQQSTAHLNKTLTHINNVPNLHEMQAQQAFLLIFLLLRCHEWQDQGLFFFIF